MSSGLHDGLKAKPSDPRPDRPQSVFRGLQGLPQPKLELGFQLLTATLTPKHYLRGESGKSETRLSTVLATLAEVGRQRQKSQLGRADLVRTPTGVYYEDLYPLIACLPRYQFPSSVAEGLDADKAALLGIWRTAHPTSGDVYLPYDCAPAPTPAAGTETPATMLSGSTYFPGTMGSATSKGTNLDADLELGMKGGRTRSKINLLPASNPPATSVYDFVPVLKVFRPMLRFFTARKGRGAIVGRRRPQIESNIPLEISLFLSGYVSALVSRGTLGAPFVSIFFGSLNALQDS